MVIIDTIFNSIDYWMLKQNNRSVTLVDAKGIWPTIIHKRATAYNLSVNTQSNSLTEHFTLAGHERMKFIWCTCGEDLGFLFPRPAMPAAFPRSLHVKRCRQPVEELWTSGDDFKIKVVTCDLFSSFCPYWILCTNTYGYNYPNIFF